MSPSESTPLEVARIRRALSARRVEYVTAESGDTGVDGVWFSVVGADGQVLDVRAEWPGRLPFHKLDAVRGLIARFHAENYWPTCTFGVLDDGSITVGARVSWDVETGVADRQLDAMMQMAEAKIREFFREVDQL